MPTSGFTLWWIFVAGLLAVLVLVAGLGIAMIVAQHQRSALRRQFARRLVDAHEQERARIAREVHDDAIQRLALIGQEIDRLAAGPAGTGEAQPTVTLEGIREEVRDLSHALRQLAHRLHPSGLEHLTLDTALEQLADEFRGASRLDVSVAIDRGGGGQLPKPIKLAAYRIAQEALHNVAKHAQAERVVVRMIQRAKEVELAVSDDGRGFQPGVPSEGLGLVSMAERGALVGGTVTVDSKPGRGTVIRAQLPLSLNDDEADSASGG